MKLLPLIALLASCAAPLFPAASLTAGDMRRVHCHDVTDIETPVRICRYESDDRCAERIDIAGEDYQIWVRPDCDTARRLRKLLATEMGVEA